MKVKLTNNSTGMIVCDFKYGNDTLRLNKKQSKTVDSGILTPHIKNLISKGLLLSVNVEEKRQSAQAVKETKKTFVEKEEKQDGNI